MDDFVGSSVEGGAVEENSSRAELQIVSALRPKSAQGEAESMVFWRSEIWRGGWRGGGFVWGEVLHFCVVKCEERSDEL